MMSSQSVNQNGKKGKRESNRQNKKKNERTQARKKQNVEHYGMRSGKGNNISKIVKVIP